MARPAPLTAAALALCLLLAPPARAWYKPAAGPGLPSVGRAAGLLSGLRRAPFARRSEPAAAAEPGPRLPPRGLARCAQDGRPRPPSCPRLPDGRAAAQCPAALALSLRAAACRRA